MRAIIENKIYDTEKAEKIVEFTQRVITGQVFGHTRYDNREMHLYKTQKGAWFIHKLLIEGYSNIREEIEVIDKGEVKEILIAVNDVENYEKYFGKLEEA